MSEAIHEIALPGFPDGLASAASVVTSTRLSPKTKYGLMLVAEGLDYRSAAKMTGTHRNALHRAAKRHGLVPVHTMRQNERSRLIESVEAIRQAERATGLPTEQLAKYVSKINHVATTCRLQDGEALQL